MLTVGRDLEFTVVVAVAALVVLAVGLAALSVHQHAQLLDLRARVPLPDADAATDGAARDAIVVMIHNHHEVAAGRNRLARGLSALSPSLVRRLVHRETVRELREKLAAEGIDADVRVRHVVPQDPNA